MNSRDYIPASYALLIGAVILLLLVVLHHLHMLDGLEALNITN